MNNILKATILFGVLTVVGAITLTLGLVLSQGSLRPNIEYGNYTVPKGTSVTNLKAELDETDLKVVISDTATEITLEYPIKRTARGALINEIKADVADGTLSLSEKSYAYRSIFVLYDDAKMTLTIPRDTLLSYEINGDTSDVTLPDGLVAENISVSLSTADVKIGKETRASALSVALTTGDIEIGSAVVSGNATASTNTGDIHLLGYFAAEHISLSTTTGDTYVTGEVLANSLKHKASTGDLSVDGKIRVAELTASFSTGDLTVSGLLDAGTVRIEGRTGDVSLILLGSRDDYTVNTSTTTGDNGIGSYPGGERTLDVALTTGDIAVSFTN